MGHSRDVVAAVNRAGRLGALGATIHTPDAIHGELDWIDQQVDIKL